MVARVLLAGMESDDNSWARTIKGYGCELLYTTGDSGKFPTDADAVVIVKSWISTQKFTDVKNAYHFMKKPIFVSGQGFSLIKEAFEKFIQERAMLGRAPEVIVRKHQSAWNPPIQKALAPPEPVKRTMLTVDERERVKKIIKECDDAKMDTQETCDMLAAEGLKKANGEPFDNADVGQYRYNMGLTKKTKDAEVKPVVAAPKAAPVKDLVDKQLELIGKVLGNSRLSAEEKIRIAAKIQSGDMVEETLISTRPKGDNLEIVRTTILVSEPVTIMTLTKDQARAVKQVLRDIEHFAN